MDPTEAPTAAFTILQFIPIIILTIPFVALTAYIAIKKGGNPILWSFIGFIPFINFCGVLWLLSQIDKRLQVQIQELKNEIEKLKST